SFVPIKPVPPITTIFIVGLLPTGCLLNIPRQRSCREADTGSGGERGGKPAPAFPHRASQLAATFTLLAAVSISSAAAAGLATKSRWMAPGRSTTVEPARFAIMRWRSGGIIWSFAESKYQLGLVFHAATVCLPVA